MNKWKWWSFMSIVCIMDKWVPTPLHYFTLILGLNGAEASLPITVYLMYSTQLEKASVKDRIWIFSMVGSGFSTFKREYCNLLLLTVILIKKIFFALFIIWHDLTSLFSISALLNVSFENQNFFEVPRVPGLLDIHISQMKVKKTQLYLWKISHRFFFLFKSHMWKSFYEFIRLSALGDCVVICMPQRGTVRAPHQLFDKKEPTPP